MLKVNRKLSPYVLIIFAAIAALSIHAGQANASDINNDGQMNLKDAIAGLQVCAGTEPLLAENMDFRLGVETVISVLRCIAGINDCWMITQDESIVRIAYGSGANFPQYAALDLESSYFRMVYGPDSGWGTSVILLPCFWEDGASAVYHQGASISYGWRIEDGDLILVISGSISALNVSGEVRVSPPAQNAISATVAMNAEGDVQLADRPGEAFKPVMLSSMRISENEWDARSAYIGSGFYEIPESGWMMASPVWGTLFGLKGGSSDWKPNAPTIEVTLAQNIAITGYVTPSQDPNDDNIGFWAASDELLRSWTYLLTYRKAMS